MNQATLNTDTRIYLVKINTLAVRGKFIFSDANELVKILKQRDNAVRGIEYLKTFDTSKDKFIRISKSDFLRFNKFDTELIEYYKNIAYFKK